MEDGGPLSSCLCFVRLFWIYIMTVVFTGTGYLKRKIFNFILCFLVVLGGSLFVADQ